MKKLYFPSCWFCWFRCFYVKLRISDCGSLWNKITFS